MATTTPTAAQTTVSGRPPRRFHWAVRALFTILAFFVMLVVAGLVMFGGRALLNVEEPPPALVLAGYVVASATAVGLAILLVRTVDRRPVSNLRFAPTPQGLLGALIGLVLSAAIMIAVRLAANAAGAALHEAPSNTTPTAILLAVGAAVLWQGFPEEVLFRGYLLQSVGKGIWFSAIVSILAFTTYHVISADRSAFVPALLLSLAFAALATGMAVYYRSVWPAVAVHAGFHLSKLVTGPLGLGDNAPTYLGGSALFLLAGVAFLWLSVRAGRHLPA